MIACIFPNDPIQAYFEKGEIKERYFNPNDIFDEIHIISFTEKDIEESKVQKIAGNAKLIIHSVGEINLKNRKKYVPKVLELVDKIKSCKNDESNPEEYIIPIESLLVKRQLIQRKRV